MAKAPDVGRAAMSLSAWVTVFKNMLWLLGGLSAVLVAAALFLFEQVGPIAAAIVGFAACLTLGFGLGVATHRALARSRDTPLGYRILRHEATYVVDAADLRAHKRKVVQKIQAKRKNVNLVEGRYRWTGDGKIVKHIGGKHDIKVMPLPVARAGEWEYYLLHFPALLKWKTRDVSEELHLRDEQGGMQPFFQKTVQDYIDTLVITVELPPFLVSGDSIQCVEEKHIGGKIEPVREWDYTYSESTGHLTATFKPTRRGHTYGFRWDWPSYASLISEGKVDYGVAGDTMKAGGN